MPSPLENGSATLDAILARAESDTAFRRRLLADPRTAIHDDFGVRIPDDVRLRFIERDPDVDALIVLPDVRSTPAASAAEELSDADLEQVTGGANASNAQLSWKRAVAPKRPGILPHV